MARKFDELRAKMSPESRERARQMAQKMLEELIPSDKLPEVTCRYGFDPEQTALIERLQKKVRGFDAVSYKPTMIIDPPVGPYSNLAKIMAWLKELDAMDDCPDVNHAIVDALGWLKYI